MIECTLYDLKGFYHFNWQIKFAHLLHLFSWALFQVEVDEDPAEAKSDEQDDKTEV